MLETRSSWLYVSALIILGVIFASGSCIAATRGMRLSPDTNTLWHLMFQTIVALWIRADRLSRQLKMPFEFDAFVFFLCPALVPYYFCKTRGLRGSLIALGVYALILVPLVFAAIADMASRL